jgi:hypothetical protein
VALIALAGPDSTLLDGAGAGPVLTFELVGPETLVDGFTITGGVLRGDGEDGAGVRCVKRASPRLNRSRVVGNRALGAGAAGGGIACLDGSNPVLANLMIDGNEAEVGGGLYIGRRDGWDSSPVVGACEVTRNHARRRGGGIAITGASDAVLSLNVVAWNTARQGGGGIAIERAQPRCDGNVVWANVDSAGVASGILLADYAAPTIERTIVARNRGGPGVRCETAQLQEWQAFRCNDVWGHPDGDFSPECAVYPGNLSVDPALCDPESGRFGLRRGSPCLDVEGCGRIGAFGVLCDEDGRAVAPGAGAPGNGASP